MLKIQHGVNVIKYLCIMFINTNNFLFIQIFYVTLWNHLYKMILHLFFYTADNNNKE